MTTSNAGAGRALTAGEQDECHAAANRAVNYDGDAVYSPTWNGAYFAKAAAIRARPLPASPAPPTVDALHLIADRVASLWADFTSQEMYGEFLREGMSPEDFERIEDAVQEMRDVLRAASDGRSEP